MNSKNILLNFLDDIIKEIENLDDTDVEKLKSNDFTISLKIIKRQTVIAKNQNTLNKDFSKILDDLTYCKDREAGYEILRLNFSNRKELEAFAKDIKVHVMKTDKIEKIRDNIIGTIIGARLSSNAIQGKET